MSAAQPAIAERGGAAATLGARDERQLRRRVGSWARWFLRLSESEFEDCYQAAWLRVMERLRAGRPPRNLEGALRWEVANSWKMELRRRRRRPSVALEACPAGAIDNALAPDPAEQVERREDARPLLELIGSLELRRRRVLLLRNACDLAPADVCRLLGISRRTYREEHARALKEVSGQALQLLDGELVH